MVNGAVHIPDVDVREFTLRILDKAAHRRVFVESDDDDLRKALYTSKCGQRMPDHRLACHWE